MKTLFTYVVLLAAFVLQVARVNAQCTTITLKPGPTQGIHAHIADNHPTQNFGHDSVFMSFHWTILGVPVESRGLLKFDLTQIPIGATITSAKLNLYADSNSLRGYAQEPTYGSSNASSLMQVTSTWDPAYVTWNTQPAATSVNRVLLPQSTNYNQNYLNLDVQNFVQDWVDNPNINYGMLLQMVGSSAYNSMIFCSSDFEDSTLWPSLEICYIPQPPCNTVAKFSYYHQGGGQVQFTNTSTSDSGYYSSWVFYNTDGIFATSNVQNPQVTYTGKQPFFASLTVTDSAFAPCFNTMDSMIDITTCLNFRPGPTDGYHAHITNLQPSLNYGVIPEFMSIQWTNNGTPYEGRSMMKFDLGLIPPGSTVVSALLDLYADSTSSSSYPSQPMFGNTNSSNLMKITSTWDKNTVTWNNQPSTTTTNEVLLGQTRGDNNYPGIDISPLVQDWVNAPAGNFGMMIEMIAQSYYNSMIFCSSDYPDSTRWPNLNVCYINGGINGSGADTLCGFVFNDLNGDGAYDGNDSAAAYTSVLVDGVIHYTDATGYYHVAVGAGAHNISIVPPFGWSQTSPVSPTSYAVTTTSGQNICGFDFSMKYVEVGINDIAYAGSLSIYPNPANGSVFNLIKPDGFDTGNATLSITDMLGREVLTKQIAQQQKHIEVNIDEMVQAGVYLVSIKNASKQLSGKVSVVR